MSSRRWTLWFRKAVNWGSRHQKREVVKINAKNGRIESVDTTRGPISTKVVLNARGPWANRFHPFPEIPLPLRLSREQDCVFDAPRNLKINPWSQILYLAFIPALTWAGGSGGCGVSQRRGVLRPGSYG
jgi:glycine/D-amino acid oxidase-like deaminating enzyme